MESFLHTPPFNGYVLEIKEEKRKTYTECVSHSHTVVTHELSYNSANHDASLGTTTTSDCKEAYCR
jgi:hypothetical protein